jgi:hypothetical protein
LWTDRHNISGSSLREGWGRHLASGVNLLPLDAISEDGSPRRLRDNLGGSGITLLYLRNRGGRAHRIAMVCKSVLVRQNHPMRNPDKWSPMEPEEPGPEFPKPFGRDAGGGLSNSRRGALMGLVIILLLVAGGLLLTRVLRGMSQLQDCALSGRSNCT